MSLCYYFFPSLLASFHIPEQESTNICWKNLDLEVTFISEEDGRESLVDLTKTLCEMTQRGKMNQEDISMELIDAELESMFLFPHVFFSLRPRVSLSICINSWQTVVPSTKRYIDAYNHFQKK